MKLRINEDTRTNGYYIVYYGGNWNHGSYKCNTQMELREFLSSNIFDSITKIEYVVDETDKWKEFANVLYQNVDRNSISDEQYRKLFDRGITAK